ncbi:MAG: hypothetical protein ACI4AO_07540 [Anaerotignum sp.]
MWKKIFLVLSLSLALTSCASPEEKLEGFWLAENGSSLSFNNSEKIVIQDGIACDYSIFDENKLSVSFLGFTETYEFNISSDTLTITSLTDYSTYTYYKGSKKQAQIRENLNKIDEEENLRAEIEQSEKEYNDYIDSLKTDLKKLDSKIQNNYDWIASEEEWIANLDEDIADVYESNYPDANDLAASYIEQQKQSYTNITQYEQEIVDLEAEKAEIISTLTELGEY